MTPRVAVLGGGFSGVATALNLAAAATVPLDITLVDPAPSVGRGVAYGTDDPDHRLNGPSVVHFLLLHDHEHFTRWHATSGAQRADPDSIVGEAVFARRRDFGRFVAEQFAAGASNPSGSRLAHRRGRAVGIAGSSVQLADGDALAADLVVVTTSNGPPAIPAGLQSVRDAPAFVADPWASGALDQVPADGRILMVGTGLTMADIAVTLRRERPAVRITSVSRRGLLPRSLPKTRRSLDIVDVLVRRQPAFLDRHPNLQTARHALRAVRAEIRAAEQAGEEWHAPFDDLRDAAHVLWPRLSAADQARFVRHLATWYEVHRFRYPPPTERVVRGALATGALTVEAARIVSARTVAEGIEVDRRRADGETLSETFGAVINCTGPERTPRRSNDPLLASLVESGAIVPNRVGMGVEVDDLSRAIDGDGNAQDRLRVVGPLVRGRFGECMGVPHIVARMTEAIPSMLATLGQSETVGPADRSSGRRHRA